MVSSKITKQLNEAWLMEYAREEPSYNPLDILRGDDDSEFEKKIAWLFSRPEFFSFTCKHIMNIELLPFQDVLLSEIWNRKFPMFVASRGAGKATTLNTLVLTNRGFVRMGDINLLDLVYGRDGKTYPITGIYPQGQKRVCELTLLDGRKIKCCEDHLWVVLNQSKEKVVTTKQIIDSGVFYPPKEKGGKVYKYKIPNCSPMEFEKKELPLHPYLMGCLLGDGCMTTATPKISSGDQFIIDEFRRLLPDFKIEVDESTGFNYTIVDLNKDLFEFKSSSGNAYLRKSGNRLTTILRDLKIDVTCKFKFIPEIYKTSSYEDRMELVRGLLDTDGSINKYGSIEFTNTCEKLIDDIIDVLRSLGITCAKSIDDRTGQPHNIRGHECFRTSCFRVFINTSLPVFKLPRKLERIKTKSTSGEKYVSIIEAKYTDTFEDMQCISVGSPDNTFILGDYTVTHNTWLLALYSLLRALILPNRKIMIAGASFRQSRFLHEYMEGIWKNAPILRDLCDVNSGPTRSPDVCTFVINNSTIKAIPIGTGDKIRGYRAHDLVVDEFACLVSSTIIQTDQGLIKLSDYLSGDAYDLINIDGELETPDQIFKTPKTDVYRIETDNGYSFSCSSIHQVMTKDGWKLAKDLTIEDHLPLDTNTYFPDRILEKNGYVLDEKLAWLIGILISEGTVTNRNYIQITNTDKELIDKVLSEFSGFDWKIVEKEPYIDKRGFDCKRCWSIQYNDVDFRTALRDFGVSYDISLNKTIPSGILLSPKNIIASFLSGLFEGDGSAFYYDDKGKKRIGVAYYTSSKELADTLQILLLKFGITCSNVIKNSSELSDRKSYMLGLRGTNATKAFDLLDIIKWRGKFDNAYLWKKKPTISVVTKKTTRYNLSTSIANKNKHLGSFSSREEAVAFFEEYIKTEKPYFRVRSVELLPEQEHLYDFHMPKTHTFIGNGFIQHNSHNREIFETVLAGFGNVAANTVDNVKRQSSIKEAKRLGINQDNLVDQNPLAISNQIIISGTAYYDFHFFADYWKKWKQIINSKGDPRKVAEIFKGDIPADFNWKDYSVIRLPYELIPKGFMDDANIARSRASVHSGIFDMEYSAIFCSDSKGFFKRSLIESCVASENNSIHLPSGLVVFDATLVGRKDCKYVIGVDPASEVDNFAVVIVEIHPDHRRVVHSWTINRHVHVERVKLGLVKEDNFYSYCARKIRDLMRLFPTERIMLDSQGGGVAVSEALHETSNLYENEVPIWQIIDEKKEKPSDDESGLHIIEMVNFASADWTSEANHGLRKDLEDKAILFPKFDPVILALAAEQDKANNKLYDTLEDCVTEIEELKNELVLIEITQTATGRDKWDTPELKTGSNKKGRMRKDRYSALIMANMGARGIKVAKDVDSCTYGGFSKRYEGKDKINAEYIGPAWFTEAVRDLY